MLVIWCSADQSAIRKIIGPVLQRNPVEHRIEPDTSAIPILYEGDILLACGTKALAVLVSQGLAPKNRTVTSLRDGVFPTPDKTVYITFDPGIVNKDYARLPDIQWDTQLAIRRFKTGDTRPPIGQYRYVESLHEIIEKVDALYEETGKPVRLSSDLETKGLDEYVEDAWIIAASFTIEEGRADVLYFDKGETPTPMDDPEAEPQDYWQGLWRQIHWLYTSPKIKLEGANFKYDSRWIFKKWKIDVTNLKFDTFLVGSILDENRSNSLKLHAKVYTTMGGYEDDMKRELKDMGLTMGELDLLPKPKLLPYVGGDTDATYRVAVPMRKELLADRQLSRFYAEILHPSSKVFEKMERTGICLDVPYYRNLETRLEAELDRLDAEMKALIPQALAKKYEDNFSLGRAVLMREFLFTPAGLNLKPQVFTEKEKAPSTAIDHLLMFSDNPVAMEFISLLKESNSAAKTLSTFVRGFMKHLRSDGRFHPHFRLGRGGFDGGSKDEGTVTGRTSATEPAVQTIPKHTKWKTELRRGYIAPPGKVILQIDYSQGELKITACVANEPTMLKAYQDKADLHAITAAQLNGYTMGEFMLLPEDIRDELRSGGKAGNFGLIYGMQAEGFRDYAYSSYGVEMTPNEAVQKRTAFFDLYSRLPEWHEQYKKMAAIHGFVRSPLGRIRHLPLIKSPDREARSQAERQAINSPIQSCLSDLMQWAMIYIDREYGDAGAVEMFLMTHDSIAAYVPEEDATIWAQRLKHILDNLPIKKTFGWDHQLQFTTDAEVSVAGADGVHSLATLKKLKGL